MAEEIGNSDLLATWASGGNIIEPDPTKIDQGWLISERPPHEYMNWIQNILGQKVNHMLSRGAPDWNAGTDYLIGAQVNYSGTIWVAVTDNTNSTPDALSADWSALTSSDDFGASLTTAGYQRLPSGLLMQWGSAATPSNPTTVTLPIAYSTAMYQTYATESGGGLVSFGCSPAPASLTQIRIYTSNTASGIARYLTIGR